MANKEQLAILRQGVAAWNKWREENPDAEIDLRGVKLNGLDLSGVNFNKAAIRGASFKDDVLIQANFSNANTGYLLLGSKIEVLIMLNLIIYLLFLIPITFIVTSAIDYTVNNVTITSGYTIYIVCYLVVCLIITSYAVMNYISVRAFTDFRGTDLTEAIFDHAGLNHTLFDSAILTGARFNGAKGLQSDRCNGTILKDGDVLELLVRGNGLGLPLKGKKLQGACLIGADLRNLDLRETDLMQANLSRADITGAKLWGSARENWIIDGIRCDYVYWDEAGEQRTPPDRNFRPGEFEELHKQLPTFEYIFEQGFTPLDPLIMDRVVQAINERNKEFSLELVSFDKRGQPHATFTVCHLEHIEKAKQQVAAFYETIIECLKKENEDKNRIIDRLNDFIDQLIKKTPSLEGTKLGDNTTYINYGQVAAMGPNASATGNTFQQITADLSRLHEEMQRSAKTPEQRAAAEDVAKAAQAASQQDEKTMQRYLKNAGKFALDCVQKIGTEALAEYLKKMTLGM